MNQKIQHSPVTALDPRAYRNRIKTASDAEDYLYRNQSKHRAEVNLVTRGLKYLPAGTTVLDAPCGNGRMSLLLARSGFRVTGCDLSDHTLENSREALYGEGLEGSFFKRDMEALDFVDKQFESALCFRFYHHLPTPEVRAQVVSELCRVTRKCVLISYLNTNSPTMIKRRIRHGFGGRQSKQYGTSLPELERLFSAHRFELRQDFAQLRYFKSLHLACFISR
ncbi:class I SAM-dependent methyltransferase [Coraliomargarita sp. W4R53]